MKPLVVDLCAGLGGWTEGFLAEGWDAVGFDIERHCYGQHRYPAQLVLQDILTVNGRQFSGRASLIVASPPCQKYSYMAMPWTRAKALATWYRDPAHPERIDELNQLFNACFRIAKEANLPIVLENVRGAQPWVGRARWMYGSFALWGDVPALMPTVVNRRMKFPADCATKVSGLNWSNYGKDGYKAEAFNTTAERRLKATKNDGVKVPSESGRRTDVGKGAWFTSREEDTIANAQDGHKQRGSGAAWFDGEISRVSSKSDARKAASAHIAKIPLPLAQWIARSWKPDPEGFRA